MSGSSAEKVAASTSAVRHSSARRRTANLLPSQVYEIKCLGAGPHSPVSGVLGYSDNIVVTQEDHGMRCSLCAKLVVPVLASVDTLLEQYLDPEVPPESKPDANQVIRMLGERLLGRA